MSLTTGNRVYNIYINSANRNKNEKTYDFNITFANDELIIRPTDGVNVNIVSFSMLNSMYNVNQYLGNNTFILNTNFTTNTIITIPYGNYNVYTFMAQLNILLANIISVSYNIATNTYTYSNLTALNLYIQPTNATKLLGLYQTTQISISGTVGNYINMVAYQQVLLKSSSLVFENNSMDNIQDKDNFVSVSDILYWVNKQDVEPFKMINYKNEDCSTAYSYNVINRQFSILNFKLVNEFNQPIYDAPDYLLQLQITVFNKEPNKEAIKSLTKILNDIYYTLLSIFMLAKNIFPNN